MSAPYCPLPLTDKRRAYVNSHDTDISRTLEEHTPIRVSEVKRVQLWDDYQDCENSSHLDFIGSFK
jgi:hypothetical protein